MSVYTSLLTSLGLSDKESSLYLSLLELGTADVSEIARKASVKRSTAYLLLDGMDQKGFVSLQEASGRQYKAEDPQKLLAQEKTKVQKLEKALPGLLGLASQSENKPGTRFFTGLEGIKAVYEESLLQPSGTEMLSIGNAEAVEATIDDFVNWYIRRRVAQNLPMRSIIPSTPEGLKTAERDEQELRHTRVLDPSEFTEDVELMIYGNKVAAVSFVENELIGVIIESKVLATVHRQMFEVMWKASKEK
jgi:sugar-specific transcriptional regulator TrmB